ncbi:TPA: hypothetical protein VBN14_001751 [Streptococcus agalactiae]|nr:hypothetical protein [Streptococcus agalactiae]HEO7923676.1 hypothetical protein [Streptococcus agalactiae]
MNELEHFQKLLVSNWQKRNFKLSNLVIDSLVGLSDIDTLIVLAAVRKGQI